MLEPLRPTLQQGGLIKTTETHLDTPLCMLTESIILYKQVIVSHDQLTGMLSKLELFIHIYIISQ